MIRKRAREPYWYEWALAGFSHFIIILGCVQFGQLLEFSGIEHPWSYFGTLASFGLVMLNFYLDEKRITE